MSVPDSQTEAATDPAAARPLLDVLLLVVAAVILVVCVAGYLYELIR